MGRRAATSCSTPTTTSPPSSATRARALLRRAAGSTRRCGRASAAARSARTRSRPRTRTCCSTTPSRRRDVLTLAHELGHGVHASLARQHGIFQQHTPLTLAETASVFGETLVFGRLLDAGRDAGLAARAAGRDHRGLDRHRVPADRDEPVRGPRPHRAPRGGRAVGRAHRRRCGRQSQEELLGDAVEVTDGYRRWWSYVPHFIGTPGYVYAYAYGQLLALSVYGSATSRRATAFVPALPRAAERRRLEAAGGARPRSSASTSPTPASGTRAWTSSSGSSRRRRRRPARRGRSSSDGAAPAGRPAGSRFAVG